MKLEEDHITQKNKANLLGKRDDVNDERNPLIPQSDGFTYTSGDLLVDRQNKKLAGAKSKAYESLEIADDTSTRLQSQTETLTRGGERV
jgi:hypothetical protein